MRTAFGTAETIVAIMVVTLLPFLPGPYDPLALPLSMMARVAGLGGLLLVPIGALWTASHYWSPLAGRQRARSNSASVRISTATNEWGKDVSTAGWADSALAAGN